MIHVTICTAKRVYGVIDVLLCFDPIFFSFKIQCILIDYNPKDRKTRIE